MTGYYLLTDCNGREIARYKTARGAAIGVARRQRQLWATFYETYPDHSERGGRLVYQWRLRLIEGVKS
jgi:hypothetical protein